MRRRGNTLVELVVAMAALAVVVTVALRLAYATDRVLAPQRENVSRTTALAALLQDLSEDVWAARSASGGGAGLVLRGAGRTRYYWDEQRGGTVRRGVDNRFYPGVRVEASVTGGLVQVRLTSGLDAVTTAVAVRNR